MPHTWIGSEYARTIFGMLMREGDEVMQLLPGTPAPWVAGEGLSVSELPTAFGALTMSAWQQDKTLHFKLGPGLRADAVLQVSWPSRQKSKTATVDGKAKKDFSADGIRLTQLFRELVAQW